MTVNRTRLEYLGMSFGFGHANETRRILERSDGLMQTVNENKGITKAKQVFEDRPCSKPCRLARFVLSPLKVESLPPRWPQRRGLVSEDERKHTSLEKASLYPRLVNRVPVSALCEGHSPLSVQRVLRERGLPFSLRTQSKLPSGASPCPKLSLKGKDGLGRIDEEHENSPAKRRNSPACRKLRFSRLERTNERGGSLRHLIPART